MSRAASAQLLSLFSEKFLNLAEVTLGIGSDRRSIGEGTAVIGHQNLPADQFGSHSL
jgi:hypothetical protein